MDIKPIIKPSGVLGSCKSHIAMHVTDGDMDRTHLIFLEQYHQHCLRKILRINPDDRRTNIGVLA